MSHVHADLFNPHTPNRLAACVNSLYFLNYFLHLLNPPGNVLQARSMLSDGRGLYMCVHWEGKGVMSPQMERRQRATKQLQASGGRGLRLSHTPSPPRACPVPYIAQRRTALVNHGCNAGMGLKLTPKQPANPLWNSRRGGLVPWLRFRGNGAEKMP